MPPKKKKTTPIVVGTVSTRSTRRESIVNIEIIPKANKSASKSQNPKKSVKKSPKNTTNTNTIEEKLDNVAVNTTSEILEILKDWSDEDNSKDESIVLVNSSIRNSKFDNDSSSARTVDQQSLIDILEGNQINPLSKQSKSLPECNQQAVPKNKKFTNELLFEKSIINVKSPLIEESIIEECVVEDNSIIIDMSDDRIELIDSDTKCDLKEQEKELNTSLEDISLVNSKLGSPVVELRSANHISKRKTVSNSGRSSIIILQASTGNLDTGKKQNQFKKIQEISIGKTHKDISAIMLKTKQSTGNTHEPEKSYLRGGKDEDNQSTTSEDTTSQSMITVQDEEAMDINEIQMSDNSINNIEVIEEQVVFETESIIDDNNSLENYSVSRSKEYSSIGCQESTKSESIMELSLDNDHSLEVTALNQKDDKFKNLKKQTNIIDISLMNNENRVSAKENKLKKIEESSSCTSKHSQNLSQGHIEGLDIKTFKVITEFTENVSDNDRKCPSNNSSSHIAPTQSIIDFQNLKNKSQPEGKKINMDSQNEENNLCQKINESMQISKELAVKKGPNLSSDKLHEGFQRMYIEEVAIESINSSDISINKKCFTSQGEVKTKSEMFTNKEKYEIETKKSVPSSTLTRKGNTEIDVEILNENKRGFSESEVKERRRSTRRRAIKEDSQLSDISTPENYTVDCSLKEMSNLSLDQYSQDNLMRKQFIPKGKKIQAKEDIGSLKTDEPKCNTNLETTNRDSKSKNSKKVGKKALEKIPAENPRIDTDSESSETKISEPDGDSTSNEDSNLNKVYETRTRRILAKQGEPLDNEQEKMEDLHIENSCLKIDVSDACINSSNHDQIRKTKENKSKPKKAIKTSEKEESNNMDITIDTSHNTSDIDATIDEVLRKYTLFDPDTPDECLSPKDSKFKGLKHFKESKKKKESKFKRDEKLESSEEVRRSDRIKTIHPIKKKSHGLVRSKSESSLAVDLENLETNLMQNELVKSTPVSPQIQKKSKTKSRSKSSENLQIVNPKPVEIENSPQLPKPMDLKAGKSGKAEIEARLKSFAHLKENQYKTDRQICKEAREMVCDCYLAEEDIQKDEYGCGEDCLNRLLMIECGELCQVGERCTNKRFQKGQTAPVEVFKTEKKGLGLIAAANIPYGEFILEYIGEVLDPDEFDKRAEVYSKDKNIHFYFMSLRSDAIIDATMKGNISRFINHSCDPNAETQKWTVNGELRIGFFSTRTILAGEEITFDYKFQRYGKEAQKCYCEATTCRGWLGEQPDESEDEDEEEEDEISKIEQEVCKAEDKVPSLDVTTIHEINIKDSSKEIPSDKMNIDATSQEISAVEVPQEIPASAQQQEPTKKIMKKKPRKELLYEDFDQLNEDIEMVVTTGLKNQAHTLKLSRLMVRAKDLNQRKKLLRVLRRGELPCRRLFLDYHGLRLMHGYMIDAQQLTNDDKKSTSHVDILQTKLELLQTLAVLPIQNKTMLIESKVLPAVEKWSKNEDLVEDNVDQKPGGKSPKELEKQEDNSNPTINEKIDEIKFLASKLLEEWANLKESFRIPKKQRIEQMKEHEKEANRKFVESSYAQEKESSRKNDQRYRTWSRYKSERETNKKGHRTEDKDKPSAEFLKISKHERRKLFALQMELKEEERRLKQREMWRQHEMNCMMIGADPRFTAPFDPNKGFQYIWNPSIGQWQALPVPAASNQSVFNSPAPVQGVTGFNVPPTSQGVSSYNVPPTHKASLLSTYPPSMLNIPGLPSSSQQYPGLQPNIAPMVPGMSTTVSAITNTVAGITASLPGMVPGISSSLHGITGSTPVLPGSVPGVTQPPLSTLPMYPEVKQQEEDPSQVKFAGPIPPPVKLPRKWKCAKDKYGRPYYYHVKVRKSQWEPPPLPEEVEEDTESSSSETSSISSSDSSSDPETEDEIDDAKLLMVVRKQMESTSKLALKSAIPHHVKKEEKDSATPSPDAKNQSDNEYEPEERLEEENTEQLSSIDIRLKEQFNLDSNDHPKKKRRVGLCQEIIISPRTEEDHKQFKEDLKRYKATKEKLKRQKEQMALQAKKKLKAGSSLDDARRSRDKRQSKNNAKSRKRQMNEWNDEHAKKIKEVFRSTMATTVVGALNSYRKPDCKESRITNTEDFKHLARKLTHFVMLKEMKHINTIDELICTDNVKAKAREYIKKYMSKFGEVYQKRQDEPDFKD